MGRGYGAEQWADWIAEQARSGLTIASFCDSIGVSENSFYVWRRKLRTREDAFTAGTAAARLVELTVVDGVRGSRGASGVVEIDLPCGAVVRVPGNAGLLGQVLGVLLESGAVNGVSPHGSGGVSC
jgi:transposase-like protein